MQLVYSLLALTVIDQYFAYVLPENDLDFSLNLNDDYFTEEWRSLYDSVSLSAQPKWRLSKNQPADGRYQVREYVRTQWVDSTTCVNVTIATDFRKGFHEHLMWAHHRQDSLMLYPIIVTVLNDTVGFHVIGLLADELKACRYSFRYYYPVHGAESTLNMDISYNPTSTYYVLTYFGNYEAEHCDHKAAELRQMLLSHNRNSDPNMWYCAQYDKGINESAVRYEVWLEES